MGFKNRVEEAARGSLLELFCSFGALGGHELLRQLHVVRVVPLDGSPCLEAARSPWSRASQVRNMVQQVDFNGNGTMDPCVGAFQPAFARFSLHLQR